jgi:TrmH family RNA methyltransferase
MQFISSKNNRIIREAASLSEKKYRDEQGAFLIEGPNIVKEAIEQGARLRFIFIRSGAESPELDEIVQIAGEENLSVYELAGDVFAKLTHTDSPQDIAAVFEKRQPDVKDFFEKAKNGNILVLDRLQDPGNVGTVIRSAEAFGFGGIILMKGSADIYQPKIVRSSAGSILRMPFIICETPGEVIELLSLHGKKIYTAATDAERSVYDTDLNNVAIVVGNEGNGASDEFLNASKTVGIPMSGRAESLNAAIAAAIIMYESQRQKDSRRRK